MSNTDWLCRAYIFLLLLTLPMDWFAPTGNLLREFGAKPAAPLLVIGSLLLLVFHPETVCKLNKQTYRAVVCLGIILGLGFLAFLINLALSWSDFGRAKNPITQFLAQSALFAAFSLCVIAQAQFFRDIRWRSFALAILPTVVFIHLLIFVLEATGVLSHAHGWLFLFRTEGSATIDRPSGLMSEPSYFGTFAALYGLPLLAIKTKPNKVFWHRALAGVLFAAAILIRAKTFIPVMGFGCAALMWHQGRAALRVKYIFLGIIVLSVFLYMIISNAALDMQENLSSVNRIGSTELALNVARGGYGLTGVGFGQFHFFYLEKFAPNFIFASQEAQEQMTGSIESRASTYNLYARLLVETGILGLITFSYFIIQLLLKTKKDYRATTMFGLLLTGGSLGFLLTQDTYLYPPLVVGLALLLASTGDPSYAP